MNDTQDIRIIVYVDHNIYKWATDDVSTLAMTVWDPKIVTVWLKMLRPDGFVPDTTPAEVCARRMTWGPWGDEESVIALQVR